MPYTAYFITKEYAGEIGTVNISETSKTLVEKEFSCTSRGEIAVRNKGEVGMYIVEEK